MGNDETVFVRQQCTYEEPRCVGKCSSFSRWNGKTGLTGEVGPSFNCEKMVNEASKLGFKNIIILDRNENKIK